MNRLVSLLNRKSDATVISGFSYTHDKVGNRISMTTQEGTHNYSYDSIYRLTSADHPVQPDETFTYDKVGNRKSSSQHSSWTYDANNRLLSYNGTSFTYDKNGNTISKTQDTQPTTQYSYDYENRLISVTNQQTNQLTNYKYDPFGKRLSKTVDGTTTYFLYDNEDIIAEYDSSGSLIASYIHGQGIDEPISMTRNSTTYYYTMDGLGSVSELTDSSQNVVESYKYDAFGNLETPPTTGNPYTYTAREYDSESGLYYYRARYYDAGIGRFITPDPIEFAGGVNFYVYVDNNPINFIDPSGKEGGAQCVSEWQKCRAKAYSNYVRCVIGLPYGDIAACFIICGSICIVARILPSVCLGSCLAICTTIFFTRQANEAIERCRREYERDLKKCQDNFESCPCY